MCFQVWHSSLVSSVCLHLLGCSVTRQSYCDIGCSLGVIIVSITAPADFLGLVVMFVPSFLPVLCYIRILADPMNRFTRVVHSCCSCHVVLNLRKAALKRTRRYSRSSDIPLSALQFTAVSALDPSRSPLPELPSMLFSPGDRRIRGQSRSTS
jgi:hypothetical protein